MDKHEYEINQLINPKKDVVKSNSKHRDKIETLIQGRRIGGITRGGDTPLINTKVKIKVGEAFFIGEIKNSVFYPYCMPNSSAASTLWYINQNGEIRAGNMQYAEGFKNWLDEKVKNVYPITGGQPEVIDLKIGDTIDLSQYTTIE